MKPESRAYLLHLWKLPLLLLLATTSLAFGQSCPSASGGTVNVTPSSNVQNLVNTCPNGTTFIFANGVYRNVTVFPTNETAHPVDDDQFIAATTGGATLYGAVTPSFVYSSGYYTARVTITNAASNGTQILCDSTHPACLKPEDLWIDGVLYKRVLSKSLVAQGTWFLDTSTSPATAYVLGTNNPAPVSPHKVEISTRHFAFYGGNVANWKIQGFIIDKYATPGGYGAISGVDVTGATTKPSYKWIVQSNEVRNCHGAGVWLGNAMKVTSNKLHHNGEFGLAGTGNNIIATYNQIYNNNLAGFVPAWGGGSKFIQVVGLSVQHNNVHDNLGPGLWDDIDNSNVIIAYNTLNNNRVAGILHETSYSANIHDNTISNDGIDTRGSSYWYGGGIIISNSSNTNIYNNTLTNCQNGIMLQAKNRGKSLITGQPYLLQNVKVYGNKIIQNNTSTSSGKGYAAGLLVSLSGSDAYQLGTSVYSSSQGNQFGKNGSTSFPNTYTLGSSTGQYFVWIKSGVANTPMTLAQWQAAGNN